ncbi:MAG: 2-oxoacid:acceptor oxidoreductase family protein [Acidimicrobiia bacterium]|nr:2-oxoacid:acceptor oxidoreductase family protein [Acidimicrobiia bacterium]
MMSTYPATWASLQKTFELVADRGPDPIILSSLPYMPEGDHRHTHFSLVLGPPGRLIAIAIGLRAALPDTPLILVGAADSITLGTNHLIHAARRNIGMTLLLLRSDVLPPDEAQLDRTGWESTANQELEASGTPLEWASALQAALVARGSIRDPAGLADLIHEAIDADGFGVVGVTSDPGLPLGVVSRIEWPEYFAAYRQLVEPLRGTGRRREAADSPDAARDAPKRIEVRIAGVGGQGVKLSGTILSEAAGLGAGLWATHYGEYGSATRGGPSKVDIVMGSEPITFAGADRPDVLVLLSQGAVAANLGSRQEWTRLVVDIGSIDPVPEGALEVPILRLAREHTGRPIAAGVTSLGCVAALIEGVSLDAIVAAVRNRVPGRAVEKNTASLMAAYEYTRQLIDTTGTRSGASLIGGTT